MHARRLRNCGRRPTFFCRPDPARAVLEPPTTRHVRLPADSRAIRGRRKSVRGREQKPPRQRLIGHPALRSTPLGTGPPHRSRIRHLCPGVDLPLEAGTCGRLIWPESTRCTACRKRRNWLLTHAFNTVEVALSALLDGAEADDAEHDDGADDDFGQAVPLLDELSALGDPCLRW